MCIFTCGVTLIPSRFYYTAINNNFVLRKMYFKEDLGGVNHVHFSRGTNIIKLSFLRVSKLAAVFISTGPFQPSVRLLVRYTMKWNTNSSNYLAFRPDENC